jgi:transposase-like protein
MVTRKDVLVPAPHPPEFRQRAVELARLGSKPVAKVAKDLGISESCLRNWMAQVDADENGGAAKLSSGEKKELTVLRRRNRQLELENDILKRAAAYFARENVLPN